MPLRARFGLANPNPRTCGGFVNPPRAWEIKMSDASPCSVRIGKSEPPHMRGFVNPPRAWEIKMSEASPRSVRVGKSEPPHMRGICQSHASLGD
ncbi:hypothetical protein QUF80_20040 [Desulfococcaceae bacterium HSG8]|nr:hypothetical protein [Desulfococcaceae bacterium HSG8]